MPSLESSVGVRLHDAISRKLCSFEITAIGDIMQVWVESVDATRKSGK
jgi:hypothetical protein